MLFCVYSEEVQELKHPALSADCHEAPHVLVTKVVCDLDIIVLRFHAECFLNPSSKSKGNRYVLPFILLPAFKLPKLRINLMEDLDKGKHCQPS